MAKKSEVFSFGTKILLLSHSLFWLATNLIVPTLSVFYVSQIEGVTLTEVGIASLIYYLSFGLLEPVVGVVADRIKGFRHEIFFIIFGYVARGIVFALFALASNVWHIYMFQFAVGVFRALAGPADKVLFAKYLNNKKSATSWGIDESMVNISAALGAGLGGYYISLYGFRSMLVVSGILTICAGAVNLMLLKIRK